jgi:D-amino-acid dehydrogenase
MTGSDATKPDAVVIGGGVIGLSTALALARRGASVQLIEARERVGLECSFGISGLIAPSHCIPLAAPGLVRRIPGWLRRGGAVYVKMRPSFDLARFGTHLLRSCSHDRMVRGVRTLRDLARASQGLVEELVRESGADFGYTRSGVMNVCRTESAFEALQRDAALLADEGFDPAILTADEARSIEPCLSPSIAGAVLWREDAHCDPRSFTEALATLAEAAGVRIETGTRVVGFARRNRQLGEVQTTSGSLTPGAVVLAAGAWTPHLARLAGTRVLMQPGKGYHVHLLDRFPPVATPMIFQESVFAATPMAGQLRLAGTMEFVGLDLELREEAALRLLTEARMYLDGLEETASFDTWCGLRPCTPDSLPLVGRSSRLDNLYLATGHAMLGLTLASATGQVIADLIVDGRSSLPVEPLAPARYGA